MALQRMEVEVARIRIEQELSHERIWNELPLSLRMDSINSGLALVTLQRDLQRADFPLNNYKLYASQVRNAAKRAAIICPKPKRELKSLERGGVIYERLANELPLKKLSFSERLQKEKIATQKYNDSISRFLSKSDEKFNFKRTVQSSKDESQCSKVTPNKLKTKKKENNSFTPITKLKLKEKHTASKDILTNLEYEKLTKK